MWKITCGKSHRGPHTGNHMWEITYGKSQACLAYSDVGRCNKLVKESRGSGGTAPAAAAATLGIPAAAAAAVAGVVVFGVGAATRVQTNGDWCPPSA